MVKIKNYKKYKNLKTVDMIKTKLKHSLCGK
jgi:hypothetical protein